MVFINFIYGLVFFLLGVSIFLYPKKNSSFKLSKNIWLIAAFAIVHGIHEWMEMFEMIYTAPMEQHVLEIIRLAPLIASFYLLILFGVKSLVGERTKGSLYWTLWSLPFILIATWGAVTISSSQPALIGNIFARYLLGIPGTVLAGIALICQLPDLRKINSPTISFYIYVVAGGFFLYAFFGGLIVPEASFFPASILNNNAFFFKFGFPVQVVRIISFAFGALCMLRVLNVFQWETENKIKNLVNEIQDANEKLESRVEQRTLELQNAQEERGNYIKELQKTHRTLRYHVENTPVAVIEWDDEFRITLWSQQAEQVFGWKSEEMIGKHPDDIKLVYDEDIQRFREIMVNTLDGSESRNFNISRNYTKEGSLVWCEWHNSVLVDEKGNIESILSIVLDITERVISEEKLRESRARLAEAQSIARVGNWEWDAKTNHLLWSDEVYEIFDLKPEDDSSSYDGFLRSLYPEDKEYVLEAIEKAFFEGKPYDIDHRITVSDGSIRTVHERAVIEYDNNGAPLRMIGTTQDITERKKMEEELRKTHNLESLGIFAGGIAHDFNNLLTGILGNVSLAMNMTNPDDMVHKRLKEMKKASVRAKDLTQQLLTFAKGGAPIKTTSDIGDILRDSIGFALTGSNVSSECSIPPDLWAVDVDQGQIYQTINNLILNADQAMPDGGVVTVTAENIVVEENQIISLEKGNYIKISISDEGEGIKPENIKRIFDPYFTTKDSGSGLGLSIIYSVVKKHDGHVEVESEYGMGATFTIYLPATDKKQALEKPAEENTLVTGTGKVLIMDDEEVIREVAFEMLSLIGYEVETCSDGIEAVEFYKQAVSYEEPFDAVILDLTVPGGMGGKETIRKLLELDPNVNCIASSGYSNDPVMGYYRDYGFRNVISKPYSIMELSEILDSVIKNAG